MDPELASRGQPGQAGILVSPAADYALLVVGAV
jgi:hypothetical protein